MKQSETPTPRKFLLLWPLCHCQPTVWGKQGERNDRKTSRNWDHLIICNQCLLLLELITDWKLHYNSEAFMLALYDDIWFSFIWVQDTKCNTHTGKAELLAFVAQCLVNVTHCTCMQVKTPPTSISDKSHVFPVAWVFFVFILRKKKKLFKHVDFYFSIQYIYF